MTAFARVENGIVREIIRADALPRFHPEVAAQFHDAPDDVAEGWTFDGAVFAPSAPSAPPAAAEAPLARDPLAEIDALKAALASKGVVSDAEIATARQARAKG